MVSRCSPLYQGESILIIHSNEQNRYTKPICVSRVSRMGNGPPKLVWDQRLLVFLPRFPTDQRNTHRSPQIGHWLSIIFIGTSA